MKNSSLPKKKKNYYDNKNQNTEWEKAFIIHIFYKDLYRKYLKNFYHNNRKITTQGKKIE